MPWDRKWPAAPGTRSEDLECQPRSQPEADRPDREAGFVNKRGEVGFTLIEVLLATAILSIVFVVLAEGLLVFLKTTDATNARHASAVDDSVVARYFVPDVQSAESVSIDT